VNSNQIDLKEVKKFGIALAVILTVIGSIHFFRGHSGVFAWLLGFGVFFLLLSTMFTKWFVPFYIVFTKVLHAIGWFNTRLLLSLVFYLVLTPTGLIMRLFGKDELDKKLDRKRETYWQEREPATEDIKRYEKQY